MGRGKKDENKICLTAEQRHRLEDISRHGHAPVKKILHAQVLLMADEGEAIILKVKEIIQDIDCP